MQPALTLALLALVPSSFALAPAGGDPPLESFAPAGLQPGDNFGFRIAADGNRMIAASLTDETPAETTGSV
ncbi:MAG: hypothetical protein AB8H79_14425, partial [Myxococcota bacterium]